MAFIQHSNKVIVRSDDSLHNIEDVFSGKLDSYLKHSWEYAALSHNAYLEACKENADCSHEQPTLNSTRWLELTLPNDVFHNKHSRYLNGLCLKTFYRETQDKIFIAYAFRGTRFSKFSDWAANFHWFYRAIPFVPKDYYQQISDNFENHVNYVAEHFSGKGKVLKHVTTGHSLGGGLAQKAAYICKRIKLSYVFDSSPVTGYFSVNKIDRDESCKNLRIYRFYEHGEILAYLRGITQMGYALNFKPNVNPLVTEIRLNLSTGNPIKQHSIDVFRAFGKVFINMREDRKLKNIEKVANELFRTARLRE